MLKTNKYEQKRGLRRAQETEYGASTEIQSSRDVYTFDSWEDDALDLKEKLLRGIYSKGFEKPSPIQGKACYSMIHGKPNPESKLNNDELGDIIAQGQSGTGKTAAFGVGACQIVDETSDNLQCLILAPTHELAEQIQKVINDIGSYLKIRTQLIIGGTPVARDRDELRTIKPHIIVGCPGRTLDLLNRGYIRYD